LCLDTALRLHSGDSRAAAVSCRAALNAGRTFGDEPGGVSQLIRAKCVINGCRVGERLLGQGEADPADLAVLQQLVEEEAAFPLLQIAVQGDRAGQHEMLYALEAGEASSELSGENPRSWRSRLFGFLFRDNVREQHPSMFAPMNQWEEI